MKNFQWKQLLPHAIAIAVFLIVALIYCKPALDGKVLQQQDVTQWKGMAQNSFEYKKTHGHFPLWSNGMFSGMPAFQITSVGDNPVSIGIIGNILSLNLPKPAAYFFLACICFYFLSQVLNVNAYIGIIGALAYSYATYNPIIISVGHDTKMQAIAYLPAFIGSLLLIYEKKYLWGAALTGLFTALLISANHLQITYYAFLTAVIMSIAFAIKWVKQKDFKHLFVAGGIAIGTGLLGILINAVTLFSTYDYSKRTIRGGSALGDEKSTVTKTGLSKDYAFSYSMYKSEPLVMMFYGIFGGSSDHPEIKDDKSKTSEAIQSLPQGLQQQVAPAFLAQNEEGDIFPRTYWGGIGGTSGPPYIGAIICFLSLIGFTVLDSKHKWWVLLVTLLTIVMSWGGFFESFNGMLLRYLPMYNKFRAPSMILIIPTLLLNMLAILSLQKIVFEVKDQSALWNKYKKGLIIVGSVFALALILYVSYDYTSEGDKAISKQIASIPDQQQKASITEALKPVFAGIKEDRKNMFIGSIGRALLFIIPIAVLLWASIKNKVKPIVILAITGVLVFIDVVSIDVNYLSSNNYRDAEQYESVFTPRKVDTDILKDTSYYRVLDVSGGISNTFNQGAMPTSYFHKSVGGYHPAKLSIYQDLIEKQLYRFPNCMSVLNMLNTKYIIASNQQSNGQLFVEPNPFALGACWFVKGIEFKTSPNEIMDALTYFNPKDTAIVDIKYKQQITNLMSTDSLASIKLLKNDNDIIEYQSSSKVDEFAVFSEVFYDGGWNATIDGKETPIIQTNYVLRGLVVPSGNHKIVFEFKPTSVYNSNKAAIGSSMIIWLLLIGAIVGSLRKSKEAQA